MGRKQLTASDGTLSATLNAPDANSDSSNACQSYDWPNIVGAIRETIRFVRKNRHILESLDPAKDRESSLQASSARHQVGQLWTTLYHLFTVDPRRDDGVGVEWKNVGDTLYLCHQENDSLQFAALHLWSVFRDVEPALKEPYGGRLDYARVSELESAVEAVALLTISSESTPEVPRTDPPPCYVTLLQMAGIVSRSKSALEKLKSKGQFPQPDIKGKNGQPDEWVWSKVQTVLEQQFNRPLPTDFPADRFNRS